MPHESGSGSPLLVQPLRLRGSSERVAGRMPWPGGGSGCRRGRHKGLADLAWIGDEACATMPSIAVEVGRV